MLNPGEALRIDTAIEVDYYVHGGILPYVQRQLPAAWVPTPTEGDKA
jgi:hypothetical protein